MPAIDPLSIQRRPEPDIALRWFRPDGKRLDLLQMVFTWRVALGPARDPGYSEFWCFEDYWDALAGFLHAVAYPEQEPEGWVKHFPSNRRRWHGDPARETVAP